MDKQGKLIIFSAPSGSGKTTLVQRILPDFPELQFSISATSRKKRDNEVDGKDYYFLSAEKFKELRDQGKFLEWEEVYTDQFYGTLLSELDRIWSMGKHVIFDVDVKGGVNIKKAFPEQSLSIFIQPPSVEELKKRLINRGTETPESLQKRLGRAEEELAYASRFDKVIINDDLETAVAETRECIRKFLFG